MSQSASGRQREAASVFECAVCGTRRATTAIPYTRLGYPICPVCACEHGP